MNVIEKSIHVNGKTITCFSDGSIEKMSGRTNSRLRQMGSKRGKRGYKQIDINGSVRGVHRLIALAFIDNYSDELEVDHINGDPSDNRTKNLRMVTHRENLRSYQRPRIGCSSKYRGVSLRKDTGKWAAYIMIDYHRLAIGCFDSEHEAAIAYNEKAIEIGFSPEALNDVAYEGSRHLS